MHEKIDIDVRTRFSKQLSLHGERRAYTQLGYECTSQEKSAVQAKSFFLVKRGFLELFSSVQGYFCQMNNDPVSNSYI
jgi:hypothetical protein